MSLRRDEKISTRGVPLLNQPREEFCGFVSSQVAVNGRQQPLRKYLSGNREWVSELQEARSFPARLQWTEVAQRAWEPTLAELNSSGLADDLAEEAGQFRFFNVSGALEVGRSYVPTK